MAQRDRSGRKISSDNMQCIEKSPEHALACSGLDSFVGDKQMLWQYLKKQAQVQWTDAYLNRTSALPFLKYGQRITFIEQFEKRQKLEVSVNDEVQTVTLLNLFLVHDYVVLDVLHDNPHEKNCAACM